MKCALCDTTQLTKDEYYVHILYNHPSHEYLLEELQSDKQEVESRPPNYTKINLKKANALTKFDSTQIGLWRGIQGENNSCYLDSTIFAMFALSEEFDSILQSPEEANANSSDEQIRIRTMREHLRIHIVNELRTRVYVHSSSVVQFRRMLTMDGNDFNGNCSEREIDEVSFIELAKPQIVTFLFKDLNFPPLYSFHSSLHQDMLGYTIQLSISDANRGDHRVTMETFVKNYLHEAKIERFNKVSTSLVFLVPRHSKQTRVVDYIWPSAKIAVLGRTYILKALCCIETSHYVAYARAGVGSPWYFFDSMSDRKNDQNIPLIKEVDLSALDASTWNENMVKDSKDIKRIATDVAVCFYSLAEDSTRAPESPQSQEVREKEQEKAPESKQEEIVPLQEKPSEKLEEVMQKRAEMEIASQPSVSTEEATASPQPQ